MPDEKRQGLTYPLTYRDVVEILQLVNESARFESLELQFGDLKLSVMRSAAAPDGGEPRCPHEPD